MDGWIRLTALISNIKSCLRVLVVEDEADTRELIQVTLQEYGATVTVVKRGLDALELIQNGADS